MTPLGLVILRSDEGCELEAYPDPRSPLGLACQEHRLPMRAYRNVPNWEPLDGHPWTVGYGETGLGIVMGTRWTQAQADARLKIRVAKTEVALRQALSWFTKIETSWPTRADVLVNIAFNVGVRGLQEWPVTLKAVEEQRFADAGADILGNAKWRGQVHGRDDRCAHAMSKDTWS